MVSTDSVRGYGREHGELVVGLDAKFDTNRYRLSLCTMSAQDGHTILRDYEDSENTECFREKIYQPLFVMIDKHAVLRLAVIQFGFAPILCIFYE